MGTQFIDHNTDDLMTVEEFARRYRVDASVVRGWAKLGYINYELVGPRKLRRIRPDAILKVIEPTNPAPSVLRDALVSILVLRDGLDLETARQVAASMEQADIESMVKEGTSGD